MRHGGLKSVQALKTGWVLLDEKHFTADDSAVLLYLPFNGQDGDTSTADVSLHNQSVTVASGQISSTLSKFGGTSFRIGQLNVLNDVNQMEFILSTSWTLSMWQYRTSINPNDTILSDMDGTEDLLLRWFKADPGVQQNMNLNFGSAGSMATVDIQSFMTTGQWFHIAIVSTPTASGIYIDGVQYGYKSGGLSTTRASKGDYIYLLARQTHAYPFIFQGYTDDLILTTNNFFSAAPDVGKTDTITIPSTPMIDVYAQNYEFNYTPEADDYTYMIVGNIVNGYDGVTTYYVDFNTGSTNKRTQYLQAAGAVLTAGNYESTLGVPLCSSGNINGVCTFEATVDAKTPGTLTVPGNETKCVNVISGDDIVGAVNQKVSTSGSTFWQDPTGVITIKSDRANGIGPGSYLALYRKPRSA